MILSGHDSVCLPRVSPIPRYVSFRRFVAAWRTTSTIAVQRNERHKKDPHQPPSSDGHLCGYSRSLSAAIAGQTGRAGVLLSGHEEGGLALDAFVRVRSWEIVQVSPGLCLGDWPTAHRYDVAMLPDLLDLAELLVGTQRRQTGSARVSSGPGRAPCTGYPGTVYWAAPSLLP